MSGSEIDPDADKWEGANEENNDILKKAKVLSTLAESMSQFTKGEGTLRTTQDLFTQAEYFAEEANSLYKTTRQFSYQVPASDSKKQLLDLLDVVPTFVQSLQFTVKDPTVGKAATFVKVDHVIRETKNLMDAINKVVAQCFACAKEVSSVCTSTYMCTILPSESIHSPKICHQFELLQCQQLTIFDFFVVVSVA